MGDKVTVFWFRRDLRLNDNQGLREALKSGVPVLPLFIYDENILNDLENKYDRRVDFISQVLLDLDTKLKGHFSSLLVIKGKPEMVFRDLITTYKIESVFANHDYEPYAIKRDEAVKQLLEPAAVPFYTFKDQCIFEKHDVLKPDGSPYTVFTPYSKRWKQKLADPVAKPDKELKPDFYRFEGKVPELTSIGFLKTDMEFKKPDLKQLSLRQYAEERNVPMLDATTHLSIHLRFGTVSIRDVLAEASKQSESFVNELIWRDFFMMILFHFPKVVDQCFKSQYEKIKWRNNEKEFEAWINGRTGYPLVDAGMRELAATGFMHNRVRMVCSSFLIKHLLIDWRWGEALFAARLNDYDLSANNGNWQWAAGCGCDAAPYFRIFNPTEQQKKFDPDFVYITRWVPEFGTPDYPEPVVNHEIARGRVLAAYKSAVGNPLAT